MVGNENAILPSIAIVSFNFPNFYRKKEGLLSKKDRLAHINAIPDLVCSSAIRSVLFKNNPMH